MNKKGFMGLTLAGFMLLTSACSGGSGTDNTSKSSAAPSTSSSAAPSASASGEAKKVTFWHAMGGANTKVVDQLVTDFNASQSKIKVEAVFQGSYDDLLSKLKASMGSKDGPSLVQMYEIGSRFMIDSKTITPMQNFIDADKFDLSQLEPNITGYYTLNGKLNSMPFNTSNPILYYNKDLFKAAGLDPNQPPKTFEDFQKAADAITKSGKATGGNFAIYGWFVEQFFANMGADFVNNGNGRTSQATESLVNSDAGVKVLTWWKDMVTNKSMNNLGRKTDDSKKAFSAGQVGMILDSTAALRGLVNDAQGKFEVGTGFLPKPADAKEGGVIVGGASLWMMNNKPDDEQKAAWEFIKFLTSPKEQAYWSVNTGYFPITKKAYEEASMKENVTKFPQFQTAIDQLHQTKLNTATQGAVMGVFPEARQLVEGAIEEVLNGKKSPKEALDSAQKEITSKIQQYNKTVK
jgi:sn-glycerol 3-phosphate transport system substrate-binding protein